MGIAGEVADGDPNRFALKERGLGHTLRGSQKYGQKSQKNLLHAVLPRLATRNSFGLFLGG
jgi:hypothetical protein